MCFKRLLLILMFYTTSCSYFFEQKEKKSNTYDLSLTEKGSVNCIQENKKLLQDYFNIKRSNEEIVIELAKMNKCVNDAIALFVKHTKGANSEYYTALEIHNFVSTVFDSYSYDEKVLIGIVELKESLIGGSSTQISKNEVRQLPIYVDFFYQSLAQLAPQRHLLFSKRVGDSWSEFISATKSFDQVIANFKNLPIKTSGQFNYMSMVVLAETLIDDSSSHWSKTFDLLNSIQSFLAKGQRDSLDIRQLPLIVKSFGSLYLSYIEFHKFIRDNGHCSEDDKKCLETGFFRDLSSIFIFPALVTRLVNNPNVYLDKTDILNSAQLRVLKTLRAALALSGGVSMNYVNDFVATLSRIQALPDFIQVGTLNAMAPQFFGSFLNQKACIAKTCPEVIVSTKQVDVLIDVVNEWRERQIWINTTMATRPITVRSELKALLKKSGKISLNLIDFQDALSQVQHAHWDQYVHIGSKELTYKDLTIFNSLFTVIKIFLSPFNNNSQKSGILSYFATQDEVQFLYEWFRPLGLELKLSDPRSRSSGKQMFIEINLFGSTSTQPAQMDFAELTEYFQIALSTGRRTDLIMTEKFTLCKMDGFFDVFNYEKFKANCFRTEFVNKAKEYFFSTLPKMNEYFKASPEADYARMLKTLERAGRQGTVADVAFDTDAVRVMSSIAQYSESFFLRFEDPNDGDEVITGQELERALAHIKPNLARLIKDSVDPAEVKKLYNWFEEIERDVVTYTIYYGQTPALLSAVTTAEQAKAALALKTWVNGVASWINGEAKVKREDVMTVISGLSAFARASKVKSLRKIFTDNEIAFSQGTLKDANDPVFSALVADLSCSTQKEAEVREWLMKNQDKYWKDVLMYFQINTKKGSIKLSKNDIPQTGVFSGWQGVVVTQLVTSLFADPLGNYCGLPYIKDVHNIIEE